MGGTGHRQKTDAKAPQGSLGQSKNSTRSGSMPACMKYQNESSHDGATGVGEGSRRCGCSSTHKRKHPPPKQPVPTPAPASHQLLKRRAVLLIAGEAVDQETVLAALVHGALQQADGDLQHGCGCGWGKVWCAAHLQQADGDIRARRCPGSGGQVEWRRPAGICAARIRRYNLALHEHIDHHHEKQKANPQKQALLLTLEGTIWPCLIMSATICPSGLPLFMCARSRSPALQHTGQRRWG